MTQKIIKAFPPNFSALSKKFPVKGQQGILYSWGDRLYNPSGFDVPPWLVAHEAVHGERQLKFIPWLNKNDDKWFHDKNNKSIVLWWEHYLDDDVFRLLEEKYAHQAEWRAYTDPSRTHRGPKPELYLEQMAYRLSGPLYGSLMTKDQAKAMILSDPTILAIWSAE